MTGQKWRDRPDAPPPGVWRDIPGEPGYAVSDDGRVWSKKSGRILKQHENQSGYMRVQLGAERAWKVHRIVAKAFVDGEGPQVRHLDGDKKNNHASNLAWGTAQENADDRVRHGTNVNCGGWRGGICVNRSPHARLTDVQVAEIRSSPLGKHRLARQFGVSTTSIRRIRKGLCYKPKAAET